MVGQTRQPVTRDDKPAPSHLSFLPRARRPSPAARSGLRARAITHPRNAPQRIDATERRSFRGEAPSLSLTHRDAPQLLDPTSINATWSQGANTCPRHRAGAGAFAGW
ncbi:hypothetical protein VDGL01_07996 [Verticillium dahliae]